MNRWEVSGCGSNSSPNELHPECIRSVDFFPLCWDAFLARGYLLFLPIRLQLHPSVSPTTHVPHPPSLQGFCLLCTSFVDIRMHGVVLLYVLASLYLSLVNLGLI